MDIDSIARVRRSQQHTPHRSDKLALALVVLAAERPSTAGLEALAIGSL